MDRGQIREYVDLILDFVLGAISGGILLGVTILVSGGVDYLEAHVTHFEKGPVYAAIKWLVDAVGTLSAGATFLAFQIRAGIRLWKSFKGGS